MYFDVFFDLFDRDKDELLKESDILAGIIAVSPSTPHNVDGSPSGQVLM
jgi:hypothetical protein